MGRASPPLVTGVSPKEGPPGTRVTIRGENLGVTQSDLIGLKICGVDCILSAEWKSPSKIIARTGPGKGKGDIIVTTKSGQQGTCTVNFKGLFVQIGPLQEAAIWVDESQFFKSNLLHGRPQATMLTKEDEDPLGLSDEGNNAKFTEEQLLESFPEASGNMSLDNFSSSWFLLENHHNTSFDDLKLGLAYMKRKAGQRSEGPIAFMKSNLSSTMDCLESLDTMYEKYCADDISKACIDSYAVLLMQAKSCADGLFQEVLGRKDKADSTRNALSVLQRFKFLFYLPLNIERNIQKGDFNLVINDFVRAKSLFADSQVQVFKTVYSEVERRIDKFREMLHKKLFELPNSLEEQKKVIRYLSSLESTGDPAWECLQNQQKWLLGLLNKCKDDHIEDDSEPDTASSSKSPSSQRNLEMIRGGVGKPYEYSSIRPRESNSFVSSDSGSLKRVEKSGSFTSWDTGILQHLVRPLSPDSTTGDKSRDPSTLNSYASNELTAWRFKTPQKVTFIEDLTDLMTNHFPDLWKLGQTYFSGSLVNKEGGEKSFKVDTSKHGKFKHMISDLIRNFSNIVRAAFLPDSLENMAADARKLYGVWPENKNDIPGGWLPICVRHVRNCVNSLSLLDLPSDSAGIIADLALDMRTNCMFILLRQAIADIQQLHLKETWAVETDDEYGGTTQLPVLFENIVNETVQHLHEVVVQNKPGEPEIFSQRTIQKDATQLCTELLQAFAPCIDTLAFSPPPKPTTIKKPTLVKRLSDPQCEPNDDADISLDKRLIIMLSNCGHTLERVLPRLIENLNKHGYVQMNKALQSAQVKYKELDEKLFDAYVEEKCNPIMGVMEQNMYRGKFNWKTCKKPQGVRNYLKMVLMQMIEVHAEVFAVSPVFVTRVTRKVIEAVSEEMSRLIECITEFSPNGVLQAHLELRALRDTVDLYLTEHARVCFKDALEALPDIKQEENKVIEELLNNYKLQMKFHTMCFYSDTLLQDSNLSHA